jgi:hypothetical protein
MVSLSPTTPTMDAATDVVTSAGHAPLCCSLPPAGEFGGKPWINASSFPCHPIGSFGSPPLGPGHPTPSLPGSGSTRPLKLDSIIWRAPSSVVLFEFLEDVLVLPMLASAPCPTWFLHSRLTFFSLPSPRSLVIATKFLARQLLLAFPHHLHPLTILPCLWTKSFPYSHLSSNGPSTNSCPTTTASYSLTASSEAALLRSVMAPTRTVLVHPAMFFEALTVP